MSALDANSGTSTPPGKADNWLLYDGECPFCSRYVELVRIRDAVGPLRLINARDGGPEVDEVKARDLDLDEGMVLKMSGKLYHGQDCIHALSLLSSPEGAFNRFNAWVFRSKTRAGLLYPVLRAGRNTTLRLLGRKKMRSS
ncbi:DCC1-like thiol-disulfide oxidoreductase family protein [Roseovarius confluentis]|uniref:DCC1-like thiol-disulfide oxidoreductase family protein n=1 Tax=Roseovarius confluentis TaxID=1852027 RepID=UPI001FE9044E|nr:DCC1-like thiol-disulfide oxidoreductase family protein [Roseovarius confluentis]